METRLRTRQHLQPQSQSEVDRARRQADNSTRAAAWGDAAGAVDRDGDLADDHRGGDSDRRAGYPQPPDARSHAAGKCISWRREGPSNSNWKTVRRDDRTLQRQCIRTQISQVETPPPYSGDIVNAKTISVQQLGSPPTANPHTTQAPRFTSLYAVWFIVTMDSAQFNHKLVRVGDRIQLNNQGPHLTIYGPDETSGGGGGSPDGIVDNSNLELAYISNTPITGKVFFPWPTDATTANNFKATYQVFRQPVRTITPPLVLPDGIVVDLSVSGFASDTLQHGKLQCRIRFTGSRASGLVRSGDSVCSHWSP